MNVDKIIGNNIRKYRTAYNMTLKELADKLHKSISTVSKYEKGDISLDMPTFMEISHIFNVIPSHLLAETDTFVREETSYAPQATTLYMYTYDSYNKYIVQSIIELYPSNDTGNTYKAHMFNDVTDPSKPGDCGTFYTGKYIKEGFIGTYILHNQISSSEYVMISCVNNLVNPGQQLGMVSGLSNYTMLPITFKAVISNTPLTNREALMNLLLFTKEDFKQMRKTNCLSIQNAR